MGKNDLFADAKVLEQALKECENEPIQFPEAIQPHGFLLVMDRELQIVKASENLEVFIGVSAISILGKTLDQYFIFPNNFYDTIKKIEDNARKNPDEFYLHSYQEYEMIFIHNNKNYIGNLNISNNLLILELEESKKNNIKFNPITLSKELYLYFSKNILDLDTLFSISLSKLQEITNFSRLKIYKFDDLWNGQVVAEKKKDSMPSYLGLHFPASDIPAQARELYKKNWMRLIPDIYYEPVPLVGFKDQPTLDMSYVSLRNISPIHLQYLENMGVRSSFSISIIVNNKLWGLIACHDDKVNYLSWSDRYLCEFVGQILSLHIALYLKTENKFYNQEQTNDLEFIKKNIVECDDLFIKLKELAFRLIKLMGADGLWMHDGDKEITEGDLPKNKEELNHLYSFLHARLNKQETPFVTNNLSSELSISEDFQTKASGILAFTIKTDPEIMLIWFKKEYLTTISWAGEPNKEVVVDQDSVYLSPRKLFDSWNQQVRGESTPWREDDLKSISKLQEAVQAHLIKTISSLEESNEELKNFAYLASHDLREPLRQISTFTQLLEINISEKVEEKDKKYLRFILEGTSNMQSLIDDLLAYSRVVTKHSLPIEEIDLNILLKKIQQTIHNLSEDNKVDFVISQLPTIRGKTILIQQLFQNLLNNAIKYQEKGNIPSVKIYSESYQDSWKFIVEDNGIGISPEYFETIFSLFTRLHTKREYLGNGMGLALCRKIVDQHHGEIWVESELGKGSKFQFTIAKHQ